MELRGVDPCGRRQRNKSPGASEPPKNWGAEVLVAESGADALVAYEDRHLDGKRFDIALLDMQMPKMDGKMLAQRLHKYDPELKLDLAEFHGRRAFARSKSPRVYGILHKAIIA